ncbi:hypothetical protein JAAARDRAFT_424128 [Jaapia argillacea MUCL 33604]|uniref:Uncharacterized protein n=1 Tax=Jaapia argillacea MUCL 33604 TaxID=933084 RepID=A0A067PIZ1_9AGAM|nr:hypothetical protein JAAARDRAFT_424128 [Jaapia argillacea MUCL 33604]
MPPKQTSVPCRSTLIPTPIPSTPSVTTSTPYTPRYAYQTPSDSPSNPLGFSQRSRFQVELPKAMPFSKHLVLRVQVAHAPSLGDVGKCSKRSKRSLKPGEVVDQDEWRDGGKDGSAKERDGPYRIVQVPTNYTFKHLHKLLLFLFDLPARSAVSSPSKSKLSDDDDVGHLFEVQKSIVTHSAKPFSQPGHIKSGKTMPMMRRRTRMPTGYSTTRKRRAGSGVGRTRMISLWGMSGRKALISDAVSSTIITSTQPST